jgi:hypothetical protein
LVLNLNLKFLRAIAKRFPLGMLKRKSLVNASEVIRNLLNKQLERVIGISLLTLLSVCS